MPINFIYIYICKVKLYPKYCNGCSKGINDGYTAHDEMIKLCPSCFDKDQDWQKDLKEEWDKYEKNNNYEPNTYRTRWNFDIGYDEFGYDENGKVHNLIINTHKYKLMDGD